MDYPLAIAIALPASTFIVTCGSLVGKALKRKSFGDTSVGVKRTILDGILNKKFEHVRYIGECDAISGGIRNEMTLTRKTLEKGIDDIKTEIRRKM